MICRLAVALCLIIAACTSSIAAISFLIGRLGSPIEIELVSGFAVLAIVVMITSVLFFVRGAKRLISEHDAAHLATVASVAAAIEASDEPSGEHSDELGMLVDGVAEVLGLPVAARREAALVATLHDIGKVGIPSEVLHKQGRLEPREWAIMRRHSEIGAKILERVAGAESIRDAVLHAHEHWDGSGYPDGLCRDAIPLCSQIVLCCDAYHAMVTDRPYRDALTADEAVSRLREATGTQFPPDVVAALLRVLGAAAVDDRAA
jgi:HD-GYP domain-containing protein (c-di-GMP phosphodiesterase class II)